MNMDITDAIGRLTQATYMSSYKCSRRASTSLDLKPRSISQNMTWEVQLAMELVVQDGMKGSANARIEEWH